MTENHGVDSSILSLATSFSPAQRDILSRLVALFGSLVAAISENVGPRADVMPTSNDTTLE